MAKNTKMKTGVALDLPWHMIIDIVSHELGFAGCDMYDIIVEAETAEAHAPRPHAERERASEGVVLEQA